MVASIRIANSREKMLPSVMNSQGSPFCFLYPDPGQRKTSSFLAYLCWRADFFPLNFPLTEDVVTQRSLLFVRVSIPCPVNPPFSLWAQRLYLMVFPGCYTSNLPGFLAVFISKFVLAFWGFPLIENSATHSSFCWGEVLRVFSLLQKMEISHFLILGPIIWLVDIWPIRFYVS